MLSVLGCAGLRLVELGMSGIDIRDRLCGVGGQGEWG